MTKSELIDAISELTTVSKNDVKAVIESMATVASSTESTKNHAS
jgi:nucleoid DNA-binding protein